MMMMSMKMIIFCLLSILGYFSEALDISSFFDKGSNEYFDDASNDHFAENLPQKRYTYVSEYKRLPVYNFGIGKRSRPYEFGVGRRSKVYGFGLGKRFNFEDQPLDYVSDAAYNSNPRDFEDNQSQYKRGPSQRFSFGVGKRLSESVSQIPEYLANNMKKQKNNTYDLNLYEVYDLMRRLQ